MELGPKVNVSKTKSGSKWLVEVYNDQTVFVYGTLMSADFTPYDIACELEAISLNVRHENSHLAALLEEASDLVPGLDKE